MIADKEDGAARDLLMGKKFPGNGTLPRTAQADTSGFIYGKRLRILALEPFRERTPPTPREEGKSFAAQIVVQADAVPRGCSFTAALLEGARCIPGEMQPGKL
jgi:hypothetical protein